MASLEVVALSPCHSGNTSLLLYDVKPVEADGGELDPTLGTGDDRALNGNGDGFD